LSNRSLSHIEFILPYYDAEMSIKNGYLSTYGLPEADEKEKIAHTGDFPSDISFGTPGGNRTHN
jgi:hypothetical protein